MSTARRHRREAAQVLDLTVIRSMLETDLARLGSQLAAHDDQSHLPAGSLRDGGDAADVGGDIFEAAHEAVIAGNTHQLLQQSQHALDRVLAGTYGTCEACGDRIDPRRLHAVPRATLCLTCQQAHQVP